MVAVVDLVPVELRPQECLGILRVRDFAGVPTVFGELPLASLRGGPGQIVFGMAAEELERARRPPLFTHEKHCRIGRSERKRRLHRQLARCQVLRRPVADRPVADLVVGQRVGQQTGGRDGRRVQWAAVAPVPERRVRAGVVVAVLERLRQRLQRSEVAVVALALARHRGVDCVVDVVIPLRGHAQAATVPRGDQAWIVAVALGDQRQRPAEFFCQRLGFGRQLLEDVHGRGVYQRVHGVEPQAVGVEVAHPSQRAVDDVAAHLVGVRIGDVDRLAPRICARR